MAAPRIKWKHGAFRDARVQDAVRKELEKRAKKIARACGPGFEAASEVTGGRGRARAAVFPTTAKAARKNARENTLLRNLSAGKG